MGYNNLDCWLRWTTLAHTQAWGHFVGTCLEPGDVVMLQGDVGAGKTTLVQSIVRGWVGNPNLDVPSPTFALVHPYGRALTDVQIWHFDLYRLKASDDLNELGLDEALSQGISVIEWPERARECQSARLSRNIRSLFDPPGQRGFEEVARQERLWITLTTTPPLGTTEGSRGNSAMELDFDGLSGGVWEETIPQDFKDTQPRYAHVWYAPPASFEPKTKAFLSPFADLAPPFAPLEDSPLAKTLRSGFSRTPWAERIAKAQSILDNVS